MSAQPGMALVARRELPPSHPALQERGDAARNRGLLSDAARRLIAERGADAVITDPIAAAAGVGKGTLFRRFSSRAGLMIVLLDEDEHANRQAVLFGPAPLGPCAPPLEQLLAYGRARLRFVHTHQALLSDVARDPQSRYNPSPALHRRHVHVLLEAAGTTGATSTRRPKRCWHCSTPTTSNTSSTTAA
jgi:AcrR family transcriptional regulator